MLKQFVSKAAGESKPEAYLQGYVEDFDESRTKLASFFSILRANRSFESIHSRYTVSCCMFHRRSGCDCRISYDPHRSPLGARDRFRSLWVSPSPLRMLRIVSDQEKLPALYTATQALLPRHGDPKKGSPDHRSNQASDFAGWYSRPEALPPSSESIQALTICIRYPASPHRCYANSAAARS